MTAVVVNADLVTAAPTAAWHEWPQPVNSCMAAGCNAQTPLASTCCACVVQHVVRQIQDKSKVYGKSTANCTTQVHIRSKATINPPHSNMLGCCTACCTTCCSTNLWQIEVVEFGPGRRPPATSTCQPVKPIAIATNAFLVTSECGGTAESLMHGFMDSWLVSVNVVKFKPATAPLCYAWDAS